MPEPGEGEIRIRVAAATVNPSDTLFRSGGLATLITGEPPYVAGLELAGIVDAVGPNARWQVGDRVRRDDAVHPRRPRSARRARRRPRSSAAAVPDGLGLVEAATLPMNGLTVRLAYDTLGLAPGAVVAVSGAAGRGRRLRDRGRGRRRAARDRDRLARRRGARPRPRRGGGRAPRPRRGGRDPRRSSPTASTPWSTPPTSAAPCSRPCATAAGSWRCGPSTASPSAGSRRPDQRAHLHRASRRSCRLLLELAGAGSSRRASPPPTDSHEAAEAHRRLEAGGTADGSCSSPRGA